MRHILEEVCSPYYRKHCEEYVAFVSVKTRLLYMVDVLQ
jgi:hypothetical protein